MKSQLYKSQRVGVLVDVQNLYYSARNLYQQKVNFENVLKEAIGIRTLIRAIAYVVKTEEFKEKTFFEALERMGYEIKAKDLQIFYGGAKKADWDVGLAMDAIELANKLDVIVLVSGDGDYIPLVQHLKRAFGCKVEGMAFGKSTSSKLREEVDTFIDLDKNGKKYLMKSYNKVNENRNNQTLNKISKKTHSSKETKSVQKKTTTDKTNK